MIRGGTKSVCGELIDEHFRILPREAVDNHARIMIIAQERKNRSERILFWQNLITQIRTIETRDKHLRICQIELFDDILAYILCGSSSEGDDRNPRELLAEHLQVSIIRSEIMAPF